MVDHGSITSAIALSSSALMHGAFDVIPISQQQHFFSDQPITRPLPDLLELLSRRPWWSFRERCNCYPDQEERDPNPPNY